MPAYRAAATIGRAVQSVFAQTGVSVELVLCADDDLDYGGPAAGRAARRQQADALPNAGAGVRPVGGAQHRHGARQRRHHRLPRRRRCLRPRPPAPPAAAGGEAWGGDRADARDRPAHAGPCAWPGRAAAAHRLPIEDICELRMPFSPVYQKALCPAGWPAIDFAEDVILNVDLYCAAGTYPFVEGADYIYHLSDGSRSHSAERWSGRGRATCRSSHLVDARDWPQPVREAGAARVQRRFEERRDGTVEGGSWTVVALRRPRRAHGVAPLSEGKNGLRRAVFEGLVRAEVGKGTVLVHHTRAVCGIGSG